MVSNGQLFRRCDFCRGRAASKLEGVDEEMVRLRQMLSSLLSESSSYFGHSRNNNVQWPTGAGLRSGFLLGKCKGGNNLTAKPIVADRLVFKGEPNFDPLPFIAKWYVDPLQLASAAVDTESLPPVRVRADQAELVKLYAKLAQSKRLRSVLAASIRPGVYAGAFSVIH